MLDNITLFFVSFFFIWVGSGLIVSAADRISKQLRLSSFALSFFILGILTSIPEFALGLTAINQNDPEIFLGNLLGGIVVIFLFIIPILAVLGNGVKLTHAFDKKRMIMSLLVIVLPSLFMLDKTVSMLEAIVMISVYVLVLLFIQFKKGVLSQKTADALTNKSYSFMDLAKVVGGIALVFLFSHIVVDKTLFFSRIFSISPFIISLIVLSLGTNLPELSLAIRSVVTGKKDVAFGDYIGSATVNTLLMGVLTLLYHGRVTALNHFYVVFLFTVIGVILFYFFARSENKLTRSEGLILLLFYVLFVLFEVMK